MEKKVARSLFLLLLLLFMDSVVFLENRPRKRQKVAKSLHLRPDKDETSGKCCQNAAFNCYNHAKASLRLRKAILTRKATVGTVTKNLNIFILK